MLGCFADMALILLVPSCSLVFLIGLNGDCRGLFLEGLDTHKRKYGFIMGDIMGGDCSRCVAINGRVIGALLWAFAEDLPAGVDYCGDIGVAMRAAGIG